MHSMASSCKISGLMILIVLVWNLGTVLGQEQQQQPQFFGNIFGFSFPFPFGQSPNPYFQQQYFSSGYPSQQKQETSNNNNNNPSSNNYYPNNNFFGGFSSWPFGGNGNGNENGYTGGFFNNPFQNFYGNNYQQQNPNNQNQNNNNPENKQNQQQYGQYGNNPFGFPFANFFPQYNRQQQQQQKPQTSNKEPINNVPITTNNNNPAAAVPVQEIIGGVPQQQNPSVNPEPVELQVEHSKQDTKHPSLINTPQMASDVVEKSPEEAASVDLPPEVEIRFSGDLKDKSKSSNDGALVFD